MSKHTNNTAPLRVLHIGKYFPPHAGGMETYLRDLMNVQRRQGLEVMALVHSSERRFSDIEEPIDALNGTTYQVRRCARWFNIGFLPISPLFLFSTLRALKDFKPHIIHLHLPNAAVSWLLLLPSALKLRWVATWHSDIAIPIASIAAWLSYFLYRLLEHLQIAKCTDIYATSPSYAASSPILSKHRERVSIVPLHLDRLTLPDAEQVIPIADDQQRKVILTVGRLVDYKGFERLIRVCAELDETVLWIVGGGPLEADLKNLCALSECQDRVVFWGEVEKETLWRCYKSCDLFCLPSTDRREAFGIVLLEATHFRRKILVNNIVGSGVPFVATQLGGVVADGGISPELIKQLLDPLEETVTRSLGESQGLRGKSSDLILYNTMLQY